MTDTDLTDRIAELIDTSAPRLSADEIFARARVAPAVPDASARRSRISPALVLSYCGMAILLTVAIVISVGGGSGPSKSPRASTPISSSTDGSGPGSSIAGKLPLADVAATPLNWSPITYGNVQISVPSDWIVSAGGSCSGSTGIVLAVPADLSGCQDASSEASIGNFVPPVGAGEPYFLKSNSTVNGIPVALQQGTGGSSVEVALSMSVEARGPLASEILGTLTYAPDFAALNYPAFVAWGTRVPVTNVAPPVSWRTVTFGGISFRTPQNWTIDRQSSWGGCPPYNDMQPDVIELNAAQSSSDASCPVILLEARSWAPTFGVVVGAGPALLGGSIPDTAGDNCMNRNGLKVCIEPVPFDGGHSADVHLNMLTALVFHENQSRPDEIEIGLSGSGELADAIFDSIRPAPSSSS
jgi:hypothetical protein